MWCRKFNTFVIFIVLMVIQRSTSDSSASAEFDSNKIDSSSSNENENRDDCADLGFRTNTLSCSTCNLLDKFELQQIRANCLRCCNEELVDLTEKENILQGSLASTQKYPKARLEVCWCKFPSMPQIEAFVKSDRPKKFPNLTIKHIPAQNPIIKLMDVDGSVVQTLAINKWDTDTIEEFLTTHLEPATVDVTATATEDGEQEN